MIHWGAAREALRQRTGTCIRASEQHARAYLAGQQVQVEAGVAAPPAPQHEHAARGAAAVAEHQDLHGQRAW